jgi:hypothetical protein
MKVHSIYDTSSMFFCRIEALNSPKQIRCAAMTFVRRRPRKAIMIGGEDKIHPC